MLSRKIARSDLNLLLSLQVLLEERNVTRAAERLNITQPAMSKTLARLRALFEDPLFTRSSHGMQPTPRAQALERELSRILVDIDKLIGDNPFDPYLYEGEFTLALSEYLGAALLPRLLERLQQMAPRLAVRTITRVENQLEQLANGNLDFAIHIELEHYGDAYRRLCIGSSQPVLLVRQGHPLARGSLSSKKLAHYPKVRLYVSDINQPQPGDDPEITVMERNPGQAYFETSHLLTALEVLRNSDYYLTLPTNLMESTSAKAGIVSRPLPAAGRSPINYVLVAHQRTANSKPHQWFWVQIADTMSSLRSADESVAY